jgi:hypothetical protein
MERFIQYLDILEDAVYVIALLAERIRRIAFRLFIAAITVLTSGLGIWLALTQPPVAIAVAALLTVTVLYRSATAPVVVTAPPLLG